MLCEILRASVSLYPGPSNVFPVFACGIEKHWGGGGAGYEATSVCCIIVGIFRQGIIR